MFRRAAREALEPCLRREGNEQIKYKRTLNADMDVILGLLGFSGFLIGFGEGVCFDVIVSMVSLEGIKGWLVGGVVQSSKSLDRNSESRRSCWSWPWP